MNPKFVNNDKWLNMYGPLSVIPRFRGILYDIMFFVNWTMASWQEKRTHRRIKTITFCA